MAVPRHKYCVAALACLLLGACSVQQSLPPRQGESYQLRGGDTAEIGQSAAVTAIGLVGAPYQYGGSGPKVFDCSGLVQFAYQTAGFSVPRTAAQQYSAARPISIEQAEAGDLLFFRYDRRVSHVAIYLGDGRFVHAPSSGKAVSFASLNDAHYRRHFVRAGRLPFTR